MMPRLEQKILFIEWLDTRSLFFDLIPYFVKEKERASKTIHIFDVSATALRIAQGLSPLLKWKIELVRFELADIKDQNQFSLRLRLDYYDLGAIQDKISASPIFQSYIRHFKEPLHLGNYLAKDFIEFDFMSLQRHHQVLHVLTLINVSRWYLKGNDRIKLFLRKRNWTEIFQEYADNFNVELKFVAPFQNLKFTVKKNVRQFLARYLHWGIYWQRNFKSLFAKSEKTSSADRLPCRLGSCGSEGGKTKYKLGVEYYGQLNLDKEDAFSDLFFYKQSDLRGEDIKLMFSLPQDPLDEVKWREIQKYDISALVRFPRATYLPMSKAPVHDPWSVPSTWHLSDPLPSQHSDDLDALKKRTMAYNREFGYWQDLFKKGDIRLYTHWYKYDARHIALNDAMKSLGGITTIYQRAYESHPTRELTITADVVFCFSQNNFAVEQGNRSAISYQVVTGFLGDFRFPYLRQKAAEIKSTMRKNGVERIIAFLDENTLDDGRWFTGHAFTQKNYAYLIDQVLKDPRYGIIFKPKAPAGLKRRLGPVADMLTELEKSGRGIILGGGSLQGAHPPALAALAADLTIHECLSAGSAGVEAALAGSPTLFLDVEGWPVSPFYQRGLGKVVFEDWPSLWQACTDFFEKPGAKNVVGNCTSFLEEIDPFRDGRAAQRMGNYLKWLLDGLNSGLSRDEVLAQAAERYAQVWGRDKVHIEKNGHYSPSADHQEIFLGKR